MLELQKFFGVTSLNTVCKLRRYQPIFRSGKHKRSPEAVASWLRIGELQAYKRQCRPFQKDKLKGSLTDIKAMTLQSPEQFLVDLHKLLSDSGVALVPFPHLKGTYAHGATFWLGRDKAVVMMTLRYNWADIFWFSLFHELGHILLHGNQIVILEGDDGDPIFNMREEEANIFAANALIPSSEYSKFVKKGQFYQRNIKQFAAKIRISSGIIVGRLQKDGYIKHSWHNGLRSRFQWNPS